MWIYLIITLMIQEHEIEIPCPAKLKNCQVYHFRSVVDTTGIDTQYFCQRTDAIRRFAFAKQYFQLQFRGSNYNETSRLDSVWREIE